MADEIRVGILNADADQMAALREQLHSLVCMAVSFDAKAGVLECPPRAAVP